MPTPLTPEKVRELVDLEAKATRAPWKAGRMDMESYSGDGNGPFKNIYGPEGGPVAAGLNDDCRPNAAFLAELRTASPALLSEWLRFRRLLGRWVAGESCRCHLDPELGTDCLHCQSISALRPGTEHTAGEGA